MRRFLAKVMESMVLLIQILGILIFGLIFIIAPDLAVNLGIRYMQLKSAFSV